MCIDAIQMGVGGIDSWGNKPLAQHMVPKKELNWAFRLLPGAWGLKGKLLEVALQVIAVSTTWLGP